MNENRQSQRVNLLGSGWLSHSVTKYSCRLINISQSGALVILNNSSRDPLDSGNKCSLEILRADTNQSYMTINALVVRFDSGVVALNFADGLDVGQLESLNKLMQKEYIFIDGGQTLIDFVQEVASEKGICLEPLSFNNEDLNQEMDLHSLRLSSEGRSFEVHLHRDEIEAFHALNKIKLTKIKIFNAFKQLTEDATTNTKN